MSVLGKSFSILNLFLAEKSELSLEEITLATGMNKTTARRLALSLIKHGLLKQQKSRGKYTLGMRFLDYTRALKKQNPILEIASPYLAKLGHDTDETVALAIWDGRNASICLTIHPNHPLQVTSYEGTLSGLYFNSLGKAILATLPEQDIEKFVNGGMEPFTSNTITNITELKRHLLQVRQEGVAIDGEEGFHGITGIAAVIRNAGGAVAGAITIMGPSVRLTHEKTQAFTPVVRDCAEKISRALGCDTTTLNHRMPPRK